MVIAAAAVAASGSWSGAQSRLQQRRPPVCRLSTARPKDFELRTSAKGQLFAAGVGGEIIGRGADIIVVDDPIKPLAGLSKAERLRVAEFFDNTRVTRLNDTEVFVKINGA